MDDWLSYLLYEQIRCGLMAGLTLGFSLRTEGVGHVPKKGPVLLIANHQSYLDPALVAMASRRHLCFLARKSLFRHRLVGWFLRHLNAVPLDREGVGIEGLRTALHQLQGGRAVVVFPEGHRSEDGALQPLKPGVQLLIKRVEAPIVPVGLAGTYDAWPRWSPLPVPAPLFWPAGTGTLAVSVGKPFLSRGLRDLPRERLLAVLFEELRKVHARAERIRRKP
jgi:1-acyl-sn-glycerol-3-phosphate acyltransferase